MTPRRRHKARTKAGEGGGLLLQGSKARRNKAKGDRSSSVAGTAARWDSGGDDGRGCGGETSIRLAREYQRSPSPWCVCGCCVREERN